jgi:predicted transcriptional regulator
VRRLGELERRVMDVLWESEGAELTGRQIADRLPDRAYTTVLTIVDRLRRKSLVSRTTDGRIHRFSASGTRAAYRAELMIDALGEAGERKAVLVQFAGAVSPEEARVLSQALRDTTDERAEESK